MFYSRKTCQFLMSARLFCNNGTIKQLSGDSLLYSLLDDLCRWLTVRFCLFLNIYFSLLISNFCPRFYTFTCCVLTILFTIVLTNK